MARCPSFCFDPCHSIQDMGILAHVQCWSRGRFGCFESIVCAESVGVSVVFDRQEPSVLWSHFCELSAIVVVVMLCVALWPRVSLFLDLFSCWFGLGMLVQCFLFFVLHVLFVGCVVRMFLCDCVFASRDF